MGRIIKISYFFEAWQSIYITHLIIELTRIKRLFTVLYMLSIGLPYLSTIN